MGCLLSASESLERSSFSDLKDRMPGLPSLGRSSERTHSVLGLAWVGESSRGVTPSIRFAGEMEGKVGRVKREPVGGLAWSGVMQRSCLVVSACFSLHGPNRPG